MPLLNKEKLMHGFEKVVDATNDVADKAVNFAKEKELDKKAEEVKEKTKEFIKDNELDKTYESAKYTVTSEIKKAGETIEKGLDKIKL